MTPAPNSWGVVFDKSSPYAGKMTAPDNPIYIADAALYLSKTQPDLGITEPVRARPDAVRRRGRTAQAAEGQHRRVLVDVPRRSRKPSPRAAAWSGQRGSTRPTSCKRTKPPRRWRPASPTEGATAWSDNWFVHKDTKHPNCAYAWINWITHPKVQAQVAECYGEAPANLKACTLTSDGGTQLGTPQPSGTDPATTNCALPRRGPELLRPALVLGHAYDQVPRRAYEREVRRVQGLAVGLGRDQGQLTEHRRPTGRPADGGRAGQPVRPPPSPR